MRSLKLPRDSTIEVFKTIGNASLLTSSTRVLASGVEATEITARGGCRHAIVVGDLCAGSSALRSGSAW